MRVKIFSCHHIAPERCLSTDLFQTLISGVEPLPNTKAISDLSGDNISHLGKFSELRHQYYVWQNALSDLDYVGFEHYRRLFYVDPMPLSRVEAEFPLIADARKELAENPYKFAIQTEGFEQALSMRESFGDDETIIVYNWIKSHDIIMTHVISESVEENFKRHHSESAALWDALIVNLDEIWWKIFGHSINENNASWSSYLNMYIMRSDLFSDYMEIIFPALLDLNDRFPDAPKRIWGHLPERVFGMYIVERSLKEPLLRTCCSPYLFFPANGVPARS